MTDQNRAKAPCRQCLKVSPRVETLGGDWLCAWCFTKDEVEAAGQVSQMLANVPRPPRGVELAPTQEPYRPRADLKVTMRRIGANGIGVFAELPSGPALIGVYTINPAALAAGAEETAAFEKTVVEAVQAEAARTGSTPGTVAQAARSRLLIMEQMVGPSTG